MKRPRREAGDGECPCGRRLGDAAVYTYRSQSDRYLFYRCACGNEWTERRQDIDLSDPVSSDEVIEVHALLSRFDLSIPELLHRFLV